MFPGMLPEKSLYKMPFPTGRGLARTGWGHRQSEKAFYRDPAGGAVVRVSAFFGKEKVL